MKYLLKLLTILIGAIALIVFGIFIVTNRIISIESIQDSIAAEYEIKTSSPPKISYFPQPMLITNDVEITHKDITAITAEQLEFRFNISSIVKIAMGQGIYNNLDKLLITNGEVLLDKFLEFSNNNQKIKQVEMRNTIITTKYLSNISDTCYESLQSSCNLGRINLHLYHNPKGGYQFKGAFVNNEMLTFSGKLHNRLELKANGNGVNFQIIPTQKNFSSINIDISNFALLNNTIFDTLPPYFKTNLEDEKLSISGKYLHDSDILQIDSVDGSIMKGKGNIQTINDTDVMVLDLESIAWGKKIDYISPNFIKDIILHSDSKTKNGYAVTAKNVKFHGDDYDELKIVTIKDHGTIILQEFLLSGKQNNIIIKGLNEEKITKGNIRVELAGDSNFLNELLMYNIGYYSKFYPNKEHKIYFNTDVDLTAKNSKLSNLNIRYRDTQLNSNIGISKEQIDITSHFRNFDFQEFDLETLYEDFINNLLRNNYNNRLFSWLKNLSKKITINSKFDNLKLKEENINHIDIDAELSKNQIRFKQVKFYDELADISFQALLNTTRDRPYANIELEGNYLDYRLFRKLIYFNNIEPQTKYDPISIWNNNKIDIVNWSQFDGIAKAKIGRLIFNEYALDKFDIDTIFSKGILRINKLSSDLFGGNLELVGLVKSMDNSLSTSFVLKNAAFDLTESLDKKIFETLSGSYSLSGTLNTTGNTLQNFVQNLKGNISFIASQINIAKLDVDMVAFNIAKYRNHMSREIINIIAQNANNTGNTAINNARGIIEIENGKARTKDFTFTTKYTEGVVNANFDFNNMSFTDSTANINFIPYQGAFMHQMNFNLSGPLASLKKQLDFTGIYRIYGF